MAVDAVLLKGLAKSPSDRYTTAADFLAAFERAIGDCDTNTLLHIPLLSHDPLATQSPPPVLNGSAPDAAQVNAPALLPYPLQDVPTEPSRPTPRKKPRKIWLYVALPILFIVLLSTFEIGLTQFGPHFPSPALTTSALNGGAI